MGKHVRTDFDSARDELFSQIHRCGVLQAAPEQQEEWLRDSLAYFAEIFPALSDRQLDELRELGERFCQPPIPHGKGFSELTREKWEDEVVDETAEEATVTA